jgi:hypothetical protein
LRPKRSATGPKNAWPNAKPTKKSETESCALVCDVPNASAVAGMAGRLISIVIADMVRIAAIRMTKAAEPGAGPRASMRGLECLGMGAYV